MIHFFFSIVQKWLMMDMSLPHLTVTTNYWFILAHKTIQTGDHGVTQVRYSSIKKLKIALCRAEVK